MTLFGYPFIYVLAVAVVSMVVCGVFLEIGYLLGLKRAARRVKVMREEVEQDRCRPIEYRGLAQ
jgi:hypothetical protein